MKTCVRCGEAKPLDAFRVDRAKRDGRTSYCRPCDSAYQKEYRKKNAERIRAQRASVFDPERKFASDIKSRYGITAETYYELLEKQGGACAICLTPCPSGRRLAVDHDHDCCPGDKSCGRCVRGLLCSRCNPGLGYFQDDINRLRQAVAYLERTSAQ